MCFIPKGSQGGHSVYPTENLKILEPPDGLKHFTTITWDAASLPDNV